MVKSVRFLGVLAAGLVCSLSFYGCNGGDSGSASGTSGTTGSATTGSGATSLSGTVRIDGSTTVYPISESLSEEFRAANAGVEVPVGKRGTGSGMKAFIAGEIDITGASRPIEKEEDDQLKAKGIEYLEVPIAFDGVSVVVNPENTWATNMSVADLKKAWALGSTVTTWKDINPAWPADKISFYGPSDNHGTYEYFTEAINGKKNEIRREYEAQQEYTAIVQSVAGEKNSIGYVGFNYYDENKDKLKAVIVDGVGPTAETIEDGTYKPLSRPLFLYVNKKSYESNPAVKAFVEFALSDKGLESVETAKYVKLPSEAYAKIQERVKAGTSGSLFMAATPGTKITDILK